MSFVYVMFSMEWHWYKMLISTQLHSFAFDLHAICIRFFVATRSLAQTPRSIWTSSFLPPTKVAAVLRSKTAEFIAVTTV